LPRGKANLVSILTSFCFAAAVRRRSRF